MMNSVLAFTLLALAPALAAAQLPANLSSGRPPGLLAQASSPACQAAVGQAKTDCGAYALSLRPCFRAQATVAHPAAKAALVLSCGLHGV